MPAGCNAVMRGAQPVLLDHLVKGYDQLKRRLSRRLGSEELAGDALQDTWLRLQRLEDQAPVLNPQAFLLRMAVNIAVDQQRSHSRAVPVSEAEALLEVVDPAPGPEAIAQSRSEAQALARVVERLPRRRREILMMVRWEGLPQKEVAQKLGVSLRTVEHELRRAHDFCAAHMTGMRDE
ncbi:RNA polymerase sigma factor [Xenophilus arseniciresistens]|uniref:RNA polymerase sigma factor n=1 Tax=Xenophilus arseniciresistens TaxID=1283306 RepID=A0AAE3N5J9_9BURK|nr:RNA polymerase sigma factor [Xenophilus arseniciresistens]MDA7415003.1 RNA polymerase sigma factor [Xenophilus arseniciresistens]